MPDRCAPTRHPDAEMSAVTVLARAGGTRFARPGSCSAVADGDDRLVVRCAIPVVRRGRGRLGGRHLSRTEQAALARYVLPDAPEKTAHADERAAQAVNSASASVRQAGAS
jgi:hypothetical protein